MGLNAMPCDKGPDSIKAGIDCMKQCKIHIVEGSENLVKEARGFVWKTDKDGRVLPVPIEFNDHAMSAVRYGVYTQRKRGGMILYTGRQYEEEVPAMQEHINTALARIMAGQTVGTSEKEWREYLRSAILEQAERWDKAKQDKHAAKARAEVVRLDGIINA